MEKLKEQIIQMMAELRISAMEYGVLIRKHGSIRAVHNYLFSKLIS